MANPVFSTQFILASSTTGYPSFAVPANFVAVVRDFSAWSSAGGWVVQLVAQDSEAAPGVTVAELGGAGVPNYAQWQGRVVVPYPGILSLIISDVFVGPDIYVGGYLLSETFSR